MAYYTNILKCFTVLHKFNLNYFIRILLFTVSTIPQNEPDFNILKWTLLKKTCTNSEIINFDTFLFEIYFR